jgi:hypothetical protein
MVTCIDFIHVTGRTWLRPFIGLFANADFNPSRSLFLSLRLRVALSRHTPQHFRNVLISAATLFEPCVVAKMVEGPERRSATIKHGLFTVTNVPLTIRLAKLRICAAYNEWNESERVRHLKANLEGKAAFSLCKMPMDCSQEQFLLQTRFGDREQVRAVPVGAEDASTAEGRASAGTAPGRVQAADTELPWRDAGSLSKVVARDAFLDNLGYPDMGVRIPEGGATSIEKALSIAARYESYLVGVSGLHVFG